MYCSVFACFIIVVYVVGKKRMQTVFNRRRDNLSESLVTWPIDGQWRRSHRQHCGTYTHQIAVLCSSEKCVLRQLSAFVKPLKGSNEGGVKSPLSPHFLATPLQMAEKILMFKLITNNLCLQTRCFYTHERHHVN